MDFFVRNTAPHNVPPYLASCGLAVKAKGNTA